MKFVLVKPKPSDQSINLQSFMICEPLDLEYVASFLEKGGHEVDIVDLVIDGSFKKAFSKKAYDVVGFTSYLIHVGIVKQYAEYAKKKNPNVITMVGGVHAEVNPQDFESPYIDLVLSGGLYALTEILPQLEKGVGVSKLKPLGKSPKKTTFDFPHPDRSKTEKYRDKYNYIYHDACELLNQVGLSDRMNNYPHQLSGGQQQRVAIARALILKPDILCFDEPTSALDPELTGEVLKVIKGLSDKNNTMIIVTHEMEFARDVSSQVIFMDNGIICEQGEPHELFENPKEERTKQFLTRYKN